MGKDNSRPEKEEEIDGITFISEQMDPLELYPLVPRIIKIVAPLLQHFGSIDPGALKSLLKQDVGKLTPILTALGSALGEKENANLPQDLLRRTQMQLIGDDGEVVRYSLLNTKEINRAFKGRFFTMLKAMWFSLGVNFDDFFAGGSESNPSKESKEAENLSD